MPIDKESQLFKIYCKVGIEIDTTPGLSRLHMDFPLISSASRLSDDHLSLSFHGLIFSIV